METGEFHSEVDSGTIIDNRYEVIELLSTGENEALFRARDIALDDTIVQIKVFYASQKTTKTDLERFRNEVIIARRLGHPNISRVYDLGKFNKHFFYITLENLEGQSLQKFLKDFGEDGMSYRLALKIIYQLTSGLDFAHKKGIIHRNICPENIVVKIDQNKAEHIYITNFGYGKLLGAEFGFTRTGEILGIPAYMAPEQMRGEKIDCRADIYALGVLTYELITGKNPYGDNQYSAVQIMQLKDRVIKLNSIRPDLPVWINELVQIATSKDKNDRFDSAEEMRMFILEHTRDSSSDSNLKVKIKFFSFSNNILKSWRLLLTFIALTGLLVFSSTYYAEILNIAIGRPLPVELEEFSKQKMLAAVVSGDEAAVFQSLKNGVSPSLKDKTQAPLLCLATQFGYVNIIYTILNSDPKTISDVDADGRTALIIAVQKKKLDAIELLLNHGADPGLRDKFGFSALDYATREGYQEALDFLEQRKK